MRLALLFRALAIFPWLVVSGCWLRIQEMGTGAGWFAGGLRQELAELNRRWAQGRAHVESYGAAPVIVYAPEEERHGNFYDAAYAAICARPEWMQRFGKVHAQGRSLPKPAPH